MKTLRLTLTVMLTVLMAAVGFAGGQGEAAASGGDRADAVAGEFREAPMLAEMVAAGELPPVEERLPQDVKVIEPTNEIGTYGGRLQAYMLNSSDTAAIATLVQNKGWVTLPRDVDVLVDGAPNAGFEPDLARSYSWNDDFTVLTIEMRRGLKWSDGVPFTSEDVRYIWEDVIFNPELTARPDSAYFVNGEPIELEIPDEGTLVFRMPGPNPSWLWTFPMTYDRLLQAKHWSSQWNPRYNSEATPAMYRENTSGTAAYLSKPRLDPWVPVEGSVDEGFLFRRNPYFYAVDTEGNQLPYVDEIRMRTVGNQANVVLAAISGSIDIAQRNFQQLDSLPVLIENESRGDYEILFWRGSEFTTGTILRINMNLLDPDYAELRELLRDRDFRIALSIALDREDFIETLFAGQGVPSAYGMNTTSPYWSDEVETAATRYAVYDPNRARQIMRDLGLSYDSDGMLRYSNSELVTIFVDVNAEWTFATKVGEMITNYWRAIGIDARLNPLDRGTQNQRRNEQHNHVDLWGPVSGELPLYRTDQEPFLVTTLADRFFGPDRVPEWLNESEASLPEGGEEYVRLMNDVLAAGPGKHMDAMRALAIFQSEWLFTPSIAVDLPLMVYRNNRVGNMPDVGIAVHDIKYEKPEQFYIKQ